MDLKIVVAGLDERGGLMTASPDAVGLGVRGGSDVRFEGPALGS